MMKTILIAPLLASLVSAHTILDELYNAGVSQGLHNCLRLPSYDGPITDVTSASISCNGTPNTLDTVSNNSCTYAAGATYGMRWGHTLTSDSTDVIDASHKGPIQVYMAKVSNAVTSAPPTTGWFKVYSDGLSGTTWAVDKLIANGGRLDIKLPTCIAAGDYLIRGEIIALHAASSYPGAQFYTECAQVKITGGGSKAPATVSLPGAYAGSDPGITYNLYAGSTSYTAPGPSVFTC